MRLLASGIPSDDIEMYSNRSITSVLNYFMKTLTSEQQKLKLIYYLHPRIQREDLRVDRAAMETSKLNYRGISNFGMMTPNRQNLATLPILPILQKYKVRVLDGLIPTESRWESTWDGIHYSLGVRSEDMVEPTVNSTNPLSAPRIECTEYKRGGRQMCDIKTFPSINRCINNTMYWCTRVALRQFKFDRFEGGVSRMMTQIYLNMICNS